MFADIDWVSRVECDVNQAVIVGHKVGAVLPGFVLSYRLDDIDPPIKASAASLVGMQTLYYAPSECLFKLQHKGNAGCQGNRY